MATTIKLKNSVTTTNAPSSLVQGEVAINITDKKVWVGNAATTPIQLLGDGASLNFTSLSLSGNLTFTGTGNRITGDFSNATVANRVLFQTSTTNGNTVPTAIPNGTSQTSGFSAYNNSDPTNASLGQIRVTASTVDINSTIVGTGTYLPITMLTGGSERLRIDTSGNVGIGTTTMTGKLNVAGNLAIANGGWFGFGDVDERIAGDNAGFMQFFTSGTEKMRIDSSGNVGIGTSSPGQKLDVAGNGQQWIKINNNNNAGANSIAGIQLFGNNTYRSALYYNDNSGATYLDTSVGTGQTLIIGGTPLGFNTSGTERMRIDSSGNLLVGTTSYSTSVKGTGLGADGLAYHTRNGDVPLIINRLTNDGTLVSLQQATTEEGSISVSGTTVSYNGGHLSRWSQLPSNQKDDTLLKGTVMSNLDDMCVWVKDGEVLPNEQLNKMKVSDVEGDTNVAGVFVNWTFDEQCQSDDMNVAMTGDMIIRIAEGVVVQKGDLLMSAGDGTAKPQGDDIVRSKTIAKVTSNHVTCTYADGSYCVPCVLMAC